MRDATTYFCGIIVNMAERKRFAPGKEPEILTTVSIQCLAGKCWECPGIVHDDEHPDRPIFCVHSCHKKRNQDKA
jgi:hypothetical protein